MVQYTNIFETSQFLSAVLVNVRVNSLLRWNPHWHFSRILG